MNFLRLLSERCLCECVREDYLMSKIFKQVQIEKICSLECQEVCDNNTINQDIFVGQVEFLTILFRGGLSCYCKRVNIFSQVPPLIMLESVEFQVVEEAIQRGKENG